MSDTEFERDLSPQTVQVLADWLQRQEGSRSAAVVSVGLPEMVRYLCGALPRGEAAVLERGLIATPTARRRLRAVRTDILNLETLPWQAVAEIARGSGQTAEIAIVWLELTSEQMQAAERAPARWLASGWQTLRTQVETGVGEALSVWNAFLAFGTQWSRELRAPGRFALERGGALSPDMVLPGVTDPVLVEADIDSEDNLVVTLQIDASPDTHDITHDERNVLLALRTGTESWPLATAPLLQGRAEWRIPGFGAATGMPAGEIPVESLQFDFAERALLSAPAVSPRLLAEITDSDGHSTQHGLVPVLFSEEPRWQGGEFLARVELPAETLFWLTSGYRLRLDVAVSGNHWQNLGVWTLVDGDESLPTLQASCPGSLDVILPSVTLIRAQLRPPE